MNALASPRTLFFICLLILCAGWVKFTLPTAAMYALDYLVRLLVVALIVVYADFRFRRAAPALTLDTRALFMAFRFQRA